MCRENLNHISILNTICDISSHEGCRDTVTALSHVVNLIRPVTKTALVFTVGEGVSGNSHDDDEEEEERTFSTSPLQTIL